MTDEEYRKHDKAKAARERLIDEWDDRLFDLCEQSDRRPLAVALAEMELRLRALEEK